MSDSALDARDGAVAGAWAARQAAEFAAIEAERGKSEHLVPAPTPETQHLISVDWTAYPVRIGTCLGRRQTLCLLDGRGPGGNLGRRFQEEYLEWRVIRNDAGAMKRFEATTELSDYWRVLAGSAPQMLRETVAQFAGRDQVSAGEIFGSCDPFAPETTSGQRERAFVERMLSFEDPSPYNSGHSSICCTVHPDNTLHALLSLAHTYAVPRQVIEAGRVRGATADEVIALGRGAARAGRGSDPVLVERLGRLVIEGRLIAFDDPVGVFIHGLEQTRLRQPDGSVVPEDWFSLQRNARPGEGPPRYQRLVFEVPASERLLISDLVDVATEQRLCWGGQLAELIQLVVFLRVSDPEIVAVRPETLRPQSRRPDLGCRDLRASWDSYRRTPEFEDEVGRGE